VHSLSHVLKAKQLDLGFPEEKKCAPRHLGDKVSWTLTQAPEKLAHASKEKGGIN
jgi:hypothetical protein